MSDANKKNRLYVVFFIFCIFFVILLSRLVYIQLFSSSKLSTIAEKQYNKMVKLPADRGSIYDKNYRVLALNKPVCSVYADPSRIQKKSLVSESLSKILCMPVESIKSRISRPKYFVWIKRHITDKEKFKIEKIDLPGIGFIKEKKRFYPNKKLAANILGYTGIDTQGLGGIEYTFDEYLKGISGYKYINTDAINRELVYLNEKYVKTRRGYNVVLTIDEVIQHIIEVALEDAIDKWNAAGGTIIVTNPFSGKILGMVNRPTFDPNNFSDFNANNRKNKAISNIFEPGSIFKIVTASAVLEEDLVEKGQKIDCENGAYKIHSHILNDYHKYEFLSFPEIIINSSNIGIVKLAQRLGKEKLYKYSRLFGFGEKSDINFLGETKGILRKVKNWSDISIASIPIGQEVGVTALQMVYALSSIANGGKLMRPLIVKNIEIKKDVILKKFSSKVKRKVISEQTANIMKNILFRVVEEGTGRKAAIDGINVAGKTGTAQKIGKDGKYSKTKYVASFMGFAPVENPVISVIVVIDEPSPIHFGGTVSAPVFKRVVKEILSYLSISEYKNVSFNLKQ